MFSRLAGDVQSNSYCQIRLGRMECSADLAETNIFWSDWPECSAKASQWKFWTLARPLVFSHVFSLQHSVELFRNILIYFNSNMRFERIKSCSNSDFCSNWSEEDKLSA